MRITPRAFGASLVLVSLLAACGQSPTGQQVPQKTVPAALEIADTTGRLELHIAGLGGYRTQATVDQVKRLRLSLLGAALEAPQTREVSTASMVAGKGTVSFEKLPPGVVSVKVEALGAEGELLGQKEASATVVRGETAVLELSLKLNATIVAPNQGNLDIDLSLLDGDAIATGIAARSPKPSSPVLSPLPSATPSPTPTPGTVALLGEIQKVWFPDGTMEARGTVKNGTSLAKAVSLVIRFQRKGPLGTRTIETCQHELGTLQPGASQGFAHRSSKKIEGLLSEGTVDITVVSR